MERQPGIRPHQGLWHFLDTAARYALPGGQTVAVMLVLAAPIGLPGQAPLQTAWVQASVFFWTLYRPASMPALSVFAIGLLFDLLNQGPLGVQVLLLLLIHAVTLRARRVLTRSGFATVWLAFSLASACAAAAEWILVCLLFWRFLAPWPGLVECALAIGFYPFLAYYLIALHRGFAAPERAT